MIWLARIMYTATNAMYFWAQCKQLLFFVITTCIYQESPFASHVIHFAWVFDMMHQMSLWIWKPWFSSNPIWFQGDRLLHTFTKLIRPIILVVNENRIPNPSRRVITLMHHIKHSSCCFTNSIIFLFHLLCFLLHQIEMSSSSYNNKGQGPLLEHSAIHWLFVLDCSCNMSWYHTALRQEYKNSIA